LILNLKGLNEFIHHFKMDNLKSVVMLMKPNCFMATIDLKDAYYSVSIKESENISDLHGEISCFSLPA